VYPNGTEVPSFGIPMQMCSADTLRLNDSKAARHCRPGCAADASQVKSNEYFNDVFVYDVQADEFGSATASSTAVRETSLSISSISFIDFVLQHQPISPSSLGLSRQLTLNLPRQTQGQLKTEPRLHQEPCLLPPNCGPLPMNNNVPQLNVNGDDIFVLGKRKPEVLFPFFVPKFENQARPQQ